MHNVFFSPKKLNKNFISKYIGVCVPILTLLILFTGVQFFYADSNTKKITLPQKIEGIEKIEYMVNGTPRGSTSGKETVAIEANSTINFLVKIKPDYYEKLHVKDVNITSDSNKPLKLGVYKLNKDGNVIIVYPSQDELINPNQTYVSQPYTVYKDEIFKMNGVVADTFDTFIKLDSSEYPVNEAITVTYQNGNKDKVPAEYSHENNSYIIKNITVNNKLKIQINPQEAYSQSSPVFFKDGEEMVPEKDGSIVIPAVKKDNEITVNNISKNKYSLVFENYSGTSFKYKKENSENEFENINSGTLNAIYGESFLFKLENTEENFLNEKEITVNEVTVRPYNGIYRLGNIRENKTISIKNKIDSSYEISLPPESSGAYITDESDIRINFAKVNYGNPFSFKIGALEGYTQGINNAMVYAIPTEKLNNDSDIQKSLSESQNYLLTPSLQGIFTINEVREPISLIVKNLNLNTYKMVLPENLNNGTYAVSETDAVKKISNTTYAVTHGSSAQITVTPAQGKSTLRMNFECDNPEINISREQNIYTVKNITSDIGIAMSGISDSEHKVTFDGLGTVCRNEYGIVYDNNQGFITDKTGIIKFFVEISDNLKYEMTSETIGVDIESGKAKLTAPQNPGEYYVLSDVEEDVKIAITGVKQKEIFVSVNSDENSVKIKSASGEESLQHTNSVAYGSDFNFKVEPAQGTDISNISVMLNSEEEISPIAVGSNIYSLENVSEDTQIQVISNSALYDAIGDEKNTVKYSSYFTPFKGKFKVNTPKTQNSQQVADNRNLKVTNFEIAYDGANSKNLKLAASNTDPYEFSFNGENNYVAFDKDQTFNYISLRTKITSRTLHAKVIMDLEPEGWDIDSLDTVEMMYNNGNNDYLINNDINLTPFEISFECNNLTPKSLESVNGTSQIKVNKKSFEKIKSSGTNKVTVTINLELSFNIEWEGIPFENALWGENVYPVVNPNLNLIIFENIIFQPVVKFEPTSTTINFYQPPEGVSYYQIDKTFNDGTIIKTGNLFETTTINISNDDNKYFYFIVKFEPYYDISQDPLNYVRIYPEEVYNPETKEYVPAIKKESVPVKNEKDQCYYLGYRLSYPYTANISISVSNLKKKSYKFICYGEGNIYTDSNKDQFLERTVTYGENFSFKLQSKEYYKPLPEIITIGVDNQYQTLSSNDFKSTSIKSPISMPKFIDAFEKIDIKNENNTLEFTFYNIRENISIYSSRNKVQYTLFYNIPSINKKNVIQYNILSTLLKDDNGNYLATYQDEVQFTVTPEEGYDISNIVITANNIPISLINGKYTVSITGDTTIEAKNITLAKNTISFTKYEHLEYKDKNSQPLNETSEVDYGTEYTFRISLDESHSNSDIKVQAEYLSSGEKVEFIDNKKSSTPYKDESDVYHITITENVRIYVSGLQPNMCKINLVSIDGIDYYDQFQNEKLTNTSEVPYGSNFSFKIVAKEGYDISNLKVYDKSDKINSAQNQLLSANNIYTIENINANHTVTLFNVKKSVCKIEFRVVEGGKCLDGYGNEITQAEVSYNSDYNFKLSIDTAYNKSNPTVTIKGISTPVSPDADGSYTLHSIKENTIVEIIDITKNSYIATFQPTEGVIYKTAKNKPFTEPQNVEYSGSFYFKISLMDAYDQSSPLVLLNDEKILGENGGLYNITNIQDDVVITVKNVKKNPEEVTIDDVVKIPDEIASENDIDDVIKATLAYDSLSDEEKAQVTNNAKLKEAQKKSGELNHSSKGISIVGVDWNIKLIVTSLNEDKEKMEAFATKVDRRSLLSLYEIQLINVLNNQEYEVPYGQKVSVNMPIPDLTEYKNIVVAHEKKSGSMEYLDVNIVGDTAQFQTSSFSMFGIAAKKIPNYSENPSDVQIAVSDLVENEEELKSLLGEGLVSQLGDLMDNSENSENNNSSTDTSSGDSTQISDNTSDSSSSADKNLGINNVDFTKAYDWAVDHEFISVILILVVGSVLIWIILRMSQRKNNEEEEKNKQQNTK